MRLNSTRLAYGIIFIILNYFILWSIKCPGNNLKHGKKEHEKTANPKFQPKSSKAEVVVEGTKLKPSSGHKLAIIVPFRDRFDELLEFAPAMNRFLDESLIEHEIIVVNQADTFRFNRAALINAGYLFTLDSGFDYLAMHDVDLIPTTHEIEYKYPESGPIHLASPELHPKYHYANYVGGILMLTHENFKSCGGMSNNFWGWGREDDEFFLRMRDQKLTIGRPQGVTTGYNTFKHVHDKEKRPRDYKRIGDQKKEQFKRDMTGGFHTLKHSVSRVDLLKIGDSSVTILNVELECDLNLTPWCKDS